MGVEDIISQNRERKALRIAEALERAGITADEAATGEGKEWAMAAKLAGTNVPSVSTQQIVLALMREREKSRS